MSTSTSAEIYLVRLALLILVLVGLAYSDAVTASDISSATCPSTNWKEVVQAEYSPLAICLETRWGRGKALLDGPAERGGMRSTRTTEPTTSPASSAGPTSTSSAADQELDTDSPLDNANFLSFEDWKKQTLAKIGQSAENVGGHRQGTGTGREGRRRPTGINNALDSLGEDAEIELQFGGFGAEAPENAKPTSWRMSSDGETVGRDRNEGAVGGASSEGVSRRGLPRRKEAGTTCKERFNYASFDCAATVLKTNPQCTGSSAVLVENKDSYMLNECRAKDKFIILELCDDILVDTVVLANYEFFSSIFRTFRVSVSDRYPAKQWRELGVFEARNTREVQAFAVENPLIWARYLKIEFLTHYGNEFYCPVSLIRVHGTTMMEEYKHDGEIGRVEDDVSEEVIEPAETTIDAHAEQDVNATAVVEQAAVSYTNATDDTRIQPRQAQDITPVNRTAAEEALRRGPMPVVDVCTIDEAPPLSPGTDGSVRPVQTRPTTANTTATTVDTSSSPPTAEDPSKADDTQRRIEHSETNISASVSATAGGEISEQKTQSETETRSTTTTAKEEHTGSPEPVKATSAQPPSPNPTTQESFFKSVNKRLQMLESNSTLSLLYIEEQSRILRDAFNKVEKRQLAKTTTFLENLNTTVHNELREFREQYDRVWKSVAIEFEHQRIQYHQELYSMTTQLGILADELVFQKRVSVIQSVFVIVCFGLVLFTRSSVGTYIELPRVQSMVSRSQSWRSSSPIFGSPSSSPNSTRPTSSYRGKISHRRNDSADSQDGPSSPTIAYSPPTPSSEVASRSDSDEEKADRPTPGSTRLPTPDPPDFRPGSTPPTLSGHTDDVDQDEMVQSPRPRKPSDISRADAS